MIKLLLLVALAGADTKYQFDEEFTWTDGRAAKIFGVGGGGIAIQEALNKFTTLTPFERVAIGCGIPWAGAYFKETFKDELQSRGDHIASFMGLWLCIVWGVSIGRIEHGLF